MSNRSVAFNDLVHILAVQGRDYAGYTWCNILATRRCAAKNYPSMRPTNDVPTCVACIAARFYALSNPQEPP